MKIYLNCRLKNTLITITDINNKILYQTSSRSYDLKIKKKNNPYVLQKIAFLIIKKFSTSKHNKKIKIIIKGFGTGRYYLIKYLKRKFKIHSILDKTHLPFNGCKSKKQKRR